MNELKVKNFNSLRKSNIKFESNQIFTKSINIPVNFDDKISNVTDFKTCSEFYKSAVGIKYDSAKNEGYIETCIDLPKNALNIPGNIF